MATQAGKFPAVTNRTSCFIQIRVLPVMRVDEIRRVVRRLQRRALGMAELATEWRVDLVMADQAVGHLREIGFRERGRLLHPAMTGSAGVDTIQMPPDVSWRREIRL